MNAIAERLEFRCGRYIGPRARTLRRRLVVGAAAAAVVGSGMVSTALFAAALRARSVAADARVAASSIAAAALSAAGVETRRTGEGAGSGATTDWGLRLTAEVRALERTRALPPGVAGQSGAAAGSALKKDRGSLLIALLARWPEDIPVQLESLHLEQAAATLRGQTRSAAEAESLLLAIEWLRDGENGPAWTVQSRSLGKAGEATAFTAVLAPEPNTGKVSP
ncbi:MAG: hypothetical protein IBJ10_08140 [Phycisphaerales bacterium]|nr:hypothetical protein [Phycisphaerales bacterium]